MLFSLISSRLEVQKNGNVTVFDALNNQIGGVGQQQGGNYGVTFTSEYGTVDLNSLPILFRVERIEESLNNQVIV